jgi:hypothetical protein
MNLAAVDCLFGEAAGFKKARGPQPFVDANFVVVIVVFVLFTHGRVCSCIYLLKIPMPEA